MSTLAVAPRVMPNPPIDPRPYVPGLDPLDRLYDLLPAYIRARDLDRGQPLRGLLRVMAEPLLVVEDDIARLYENWFIETCDAWAVAYVAAPVGYRILAEPSLDGLADLDGPAARRRFAALASRRDAGNTLAHRRRKGTLPVFQQLANDVTGWPARAVEFRDRTAAFQNLNHPLPDRGRTVDLRCRDAVDRGFGPFATLTRTIDVRTAGPDPWTGRGKAGDIGLYVWPLQVKRVVRAPAHRLDPAEDASTCRNDDRRYDFTFSALGNMTPLYQRPLLPHDPARIATEPEIPAPIRREAFRAHPERFYGAHRSLRIWKQAKPGAKLEAVPRAHVAAADLNAPVALKPKPGQDYVVAVDPEHGLLSLIYSKPPTDPTAHPALWVSYRYGAPGAIGGGDYYRPLETAIAPCGAPPPPPESVCDTATKPCRVFVRAPETEDQASAGTGTHDQPFPTLAEAIAQAWNSSPPVPSLVIEILDDALYKLDPKPLQIASGRRLEIRAAQGRQPMLSSTLGHAGPITFRAEGAQRGGTLVLDGLLVIDAKLVITGPFARVTIRHCTLVPGLRLKTNGNPATKNIPGLVLCDLTGPLAIERSIVGAISVVPAEGSRPGTDGDVIPECLGDPPLIRVTDSILDNVGGPCPALGGKTSCAYGCVRLTIERSTVFGPVNVHAVERAQDTVFVKPLRVARRRSGCLRFCYVAPGSTTPARYRCQPDLALAGSQNPAPCATDAPPPEPIDRDRVAASVAPRFRSRRYGDPDYALFAPDAPVELTRGAEDLSEMGAFNDASLALHLTNLLFRVAEYTPAGADVQIIEVFE
jgi:hypothetical protein